MSLRARAAAYLLAVHLMMAGLAAVLFLEHGPWLLAAEAALLASLAVGVALYRQLWQPVDLARTGAGLIDEGDFSCKFLPAGRRELDDLIAVYNRMIDRLRDERLRTEEQHYLMQKILAATPSGILTFDLDRRLVLANPAAERLLRSRADELSGRTMAEVANLPGLEGLEDGQDRVVVIGRRRVRCRMSHYLDRGFRRPFVVLEELTEELRQAEKAAHERIIRLLSHEVNNTVAAANSLLHSCLHYGSQLRTEDRGDYEGALRVVISRTEQLNRFMNGFAEVVRLPPPRLQPVDLRELLRGIERLLSAESRTRRVEWRWREEEALPPIAMDAAQMEQVFVNVFRNALEAIGADGTIAVELGREAGRPRVVVADTGAGISPQDRPQLFTPFFSTKESGQGIGLTLVQEVLTRHGCEFDLDGAPGAGARFTVVFPAG